MWYKGISSVIFLFSFHSHKWSSCFPARLQLHQVQGEAKPELCAFLLVRLKRDIPESPGDLWYSSVHSLDGPFLCFPEMVWWWFHMPHLRLLEHSISSCLPLTAPAFASSTPSRVSCYLPQGSSSAVNLRLERVSLPPEFQVPMLMAMLEISYDQTLV